MSPISGFSNFEGAASEINTTTRPSITCSISYNDADITGFISYDGADTTGFISYDGADVTGDIQMPETEATEIYTDTTDIKPSTESNIILKTQNKKVLTNINVQKIPYAAVTNLSGGYTVTIGE